MMRKFIFTVLIFSFLVCGFVYAQQNNLRIVSSDGKFLGTLSSNNNDRDSIYNEYGKGSPYESDSIMNQYGNYGSDYSDKSPFNEYASNPPGLYDSSGNFYGTLSVNRYARGVTDQTYKLALQLKARRDSLR